MLELPPGTWGVFGPGAVVGGVVNGRSPPVVVVVVWTGPGGDGEGEGQVDAGTGIPSWLRTVANVTHSCTMMSTHATKRMVSGSIALTIAPMSISSSTPAPTPAILYARPGMGIF